MIHFVEYKSAANNLEKYDGISGSDAEAFTSKLQKGTGKWSSYRIDLTNLALMIDWGNQMGNRILDLQSTSKVDFKISGRLGKGMMKIKQIRFEKEE